MAASERTSASLALGVDGDAAAGVGEVFVGVGEVLLLAVVWLVKLVLGKFLWMVVMVEVGASEVDASIVVDADVGEVIVDGGVASEVDVGEVLIDVGGGGGGAAGDVDGEIAVVDAVDVVGVDSNVVVVIDVTGVVDVAGDGVDVGEVDVVGVAR